jgi:hypothetical protein
MRSHTVGSRARSGSLANGPKVTPAFQPLHCSDFGMTGFEKERLQTLCNEIPRSSSGTQPFAAPRAARGQNLAAAFARHTSAKAVAALAYEFARLIRPFHELSPLRRLPRR